MSKKFLDLQKAPNGQAWREYVKADAPTVVNNMLSGRWGECLVAAVVAEHTGGSSSAAGQVIDYLVDQGHSKFERAADRLEDASHKAMKKGTPLPHVTGQSEASATMNLQGAVPTTTQQDSRSDSQSESGDEETQNLCRAAPLHAHIGMALEKHAGQSLPKEVAEFFSSRGLQIACSKLLKISFHATWLVDLTQPLPHDGKQFSRVIVQIIGAQLCDKPLYGHQNVTAETLARASALATTAGVKVATVFGTGECNKEDGELGALDFIVQEYIVTETVEDEVSAPPAEFQRINGDVRRSLESLILADVDTEPIVRFESLCSQLDWLKTQVPEQDETLLDALTAFAESIALSPPPPMRVTLLHQDDHCHNVLCSKCKDGTEWQLDAVIDWESAAIADPRFRSKEEPWMTARNFSLVVKGANLAARFVEGSLPRCELSELVENYDRAAETLAKQDWLDYETWAVRVARCQRKSNSLAGVQAAGYHS